MHKSQLQKLLKEYLTYGSINERVPNSTLMKLLNDLNNENNEVK